MAHPNRPPSSRYDTGIQLQKLLLKRSNRHPLVMDADTRTAYMDLLETETL